MTLFINCCPREESRTKRIADALLSKLGEYEEVNLYDLDLKPVDESILAVRDDFLAKNALEVPEFSLARQFASADIIVIAAPFWDLSFPSKLKLYIENIYITGIVSCYGADGMPRGLCKAGKMYYVATSGGPFDGRYSYEYIETLCRDYFGIPQAELIKAEMLDVTGFDAEKIVSETIGKIREKKC